MRINIFSTSMNEKNVVICEVEFYLFFLLMRKLLSLSLGLLTAASSFATVKNITIPAVPDGNKRCGFVVKEIPTNLGLTDDQHKAIEEELVGWTWGAYSAMADNMVYSLSNGGNNIIHGATFIDSLSSNDTINVVISAGKMPELHIQDTVVCASENLHAISLPTYKNGTVWIKNYLTGEYEEVESLTYSYFASMWRSKEPFPIIFNKDSLFQYFDHNLYRELNVQPIDTIAWKKYIDLLGDPILNTPATSNIYMFTMSDTVTGCHANMSALISVDDCSSSVMWLNYNGPKEYHDYVMDSPSYYLRDDSIMAINPLLDCICPLSLDTIIESTQSDDTSACEHYKYDVTIKLAARLDSSYVDTIVAYIIHLDNSGATFQLFKDTAIAEFAGNCVFTVPYFVLPKEEDCKCGSYYYTANMQIGDTITESTDLIFTIKNYCTGTIFDTVHILVPEKDELVQIFGGDTTVHAKDSVSLRSIVEIRGTTLTYDWNTNGCINVPNASIILNVYKDTVTENNFVNIYSEPYILDNIKKSGKYFFTAIDTFSGCSASLDVDITVLANDSSASSNLTADVYEQAGDIYTVSGTVVMKNVYLKDALARLKEGLYIFNNKKIYIRRK